VSQRRRQHGQAAGFLLPSRKPPMYNVRTPRRAQAGAIATDYRTVY
jgi:hypothetical protein